MGDSRVSVEGKQATRSEVLHDAAYLKDGRATPFWMLMQKYLEYLREKTCERLLQCGKEEHDYYKGVYWGLTEAMRVPETVEQMALQFREEESRYADQ